MRAMELGILAIMTKEIHAAAWDCLSMPGCHCRSRTRQRWKKIKIKAAKQRFYESEEGQKIIVERLGGR